MNTLELNSIILFELLYMFVFTVRKLLRHVRPWTVVDWAMAVVTGLGSFVEIISVLDLVMHPAQIQPAPGPAWKSWLLSLIAALTIVVLLAALVENVGRRIRQLGR